MRVAARYQDDGTLVAVRIWESSSFARVWLSPEGHVQSVDDTTGVMTVESEDGVGVPVTIGPNTLFYFRTPQDAQADANSIGQGPGFLASGQLVRGFKVHVSPVDAFANPMVADTVDIETAAYSGTISNATATGFTYTRNFARASDDFVGVARERTLVELLRHRQRGRVAGKLRTSRPVWASQTTMRSFPSARSPSGVRTDAATCEPSGDKAAPAISADGPAPGGPKP